MINYTTEQVRTLLDTNQHLISDARKSLIKGEDWVRTVEKGEKEYRYSEPGVSKIRKRILQRDIEILDFVKEVESITEMNTSEGSKTLIHLAMMEYLTSKGYKNYEIAKRFPYTEGTVQVMKTRATKDWSYQIIKDNIYKIGERYDVKKSQ